MRQLIGQIRSASVNVRNRWDEDSQEAIPFEVLGITLRVQVLDEKIPRAYYHTFTLSFEELWALVDSQEATYLPGELVGKHIILREIPKDGVGGSKLEYVEPMKT